MPGEGPLGPLNRLLALKVVRGNAGRAFSGRAKKMKREKRIGPFWMAFSTESRGSIPRESATCTNG